MAKTKPKVGDPVLFYGHSLQVVDIIDRDGVKLAEVVDVEGRKIREAAAEEIRGLREEQAGLTRDEEPRHREIAARVGELDQEARQAVVHAKLRVDLLTWWPERDVWVSEGRILSDEQLERFEKLAGRKPLPTAHREVLTLLEGR